MTTDNSRLPRPFIWLNITQFLGAMNDNIFRFLVIFFLVVGFDQYDNKAAVTAAAMVAFVLPFLLFSHAAGVLADRLSKRNIIVFAKYLELFIMSAGCAAIYFKSAPALYSIIFCMSTQSAIFGPSKYGIIPELVPDFMLSKANGLLVGLSYLAIIIGTFVPSYFLLEVVDQNFLGVGLLCVVVAIIGVVVSMQIKKTAPAGTGKRFSPFFLWEIFKTLRSLAPDRYLFMTVFAAAYFLYLGAFLQQNLLMYGSDELHLDWIKSGYLFPIAALGIGIGAVLAGKVSGRNIEFGVVPLGALGLTICCVVLGLMPPGMKIVLSMMFLVGVSAGLFIVPLNAFIQYRSPAHQRGEILACVNFLSFLGAALAAGSMVLFNSKLGLTPRQCFLVIGLFTGILATGAVIVLPDFFVRFIMVIITRLFYRIRVVGSDNVPVEGGALLVANHVTWVDALIIGTTQQRRVRYVMARDIFGIKWLRPVFKLMRAIPVAPDDPPRQIINALKEARAALDDGCLVCIFAEGAVTRNGNMRGFRPGLERILKGSEHPVIPVYIGGAWGSIFSHYYGRLLSALPRSIPFHVSVAFGAPMPASASTHTVRQAVVELSCQSFDIKKSPTRILQHKFIKTARRNWFRKAVSDTTGKRMAFGELLIASIALANRIRGMAGDDEKIGVALPPTVGGVLTNLAVAMLGRVPVNLNYTASAESVASAMEQCNIKCVISAKSFLEKMESFDAPPGTVLIEDIMPQITATDKLRAACKALFMPIARLVPLSALSPDAPATIIFSSGSTGKPKGVVLTHHNIISNIEAFSMVFRFNNNDNICAVLPLFHSFGFTCTLWCPLLGGFSASYHPNPVDGVKIAELVRENHSSLLMTTPTFLLAYIRRAKREDFASLRAVVTGAEKLKKRTADSFERKFGMRPLEGYGTTELSPVVSLNLADVEIAGVRHTGTKEGSIGHPVPGVAVRVISPDTGDPQPHGQEGLLLVKGPNVMKEYLNDPVKTADVIRDGWYNTGDIAKIDDDGFVFILDRLARFSKIGGEMVPHLAVEEKIMLALGTINPVVAVTSAPDERKGEQLVVLFTDEAGTPGDLDAIVRKSDLPNLWKPRHDNYLRIETMPTLGSGKLDLKHLKELAREYVEKRPGAVQRAVTKIREAL